MPVSVARTRQTPAKRTVLALALALAAGCAKDPTAEEQQEAVRRSVEDDAAAAQQAADDIQAELDKMNSEN